MVTIHGYRFSVYAWVARFALHAKGVDFEWVEVDPFAADVDPDYLALHPFRRVPTLVHGDFVLYETGAITRYIDEAFDGPPLQSSDPKARARVAQVISIVDSYGYWPLVRQVFSHGYWRPRIGWPLDDSEVARGIDASAKVLAALETLASDTGWLVDASLTLADVHLAPMIAYFTLADAGADALARHRRLTAWFEHVREHPAFKASRPDLN